MYARIDRKRKILVTTILRAIGFTTQQKIIGLFYGSETVPVKDQSVNRIVMEDVVDESTGEVLAECNTLIPPELAAKLEAAKIKKVTVAVTTSDESLTIHKTLAKDNTRSKNEALIEIYRKMRPGDPPTVESASALLDSLFFNPKRYNLSRVGRYKLNKRLGLAIPIDHCTLKKEDLVEIIKKLIRLSSQEDAKDDIDHLGNRRVRSSGELLENQFRIGLARIERPVKERMSILEIDTKHAEQPHQRQTRGRRRQGVLRLLPAFPVHGPDKSPGRAHPQAPPFGPGSGGVEPQRAGSKCATCITPTTAASARSRLRKFEHRPDFVARHFRARERIRLHRNPYRKVANGKVTEEIQYLWRTKRTSTSSPRRTRRWTRRAPHRSLISGAVPRRLPPGQSKDVHYMDVSPKQLVSVATALIPFLEHDDANRALWVRICSASRPLLTTEAPLDGTAWKPGAYDSGVMVTARTRHGGESHLGQDRDILGRPAD
jgi:DNA-directed RNA polymerase subunit beta